MNLLLYRKYRVRCTLGVIKYQGKVLTKTLELPKDKCIAVGKYEVVLHYSESRGWYIQLLGNYNYIGSFRPLTNGKYMLRDVISPVTHFYKEAKFSRLANLKFTDFLKEMFMLEDRIWLEIVED